MEQQHGELLLSPHLQHGCPENHTEDLGGGQDDAAIPADSPLLGQLPDESVRRHQEPVHAVREHRDQQHVDFFRCGFLEIKEEFASLLRLSELGNIDWQRMLDDLARIPGNFTKENLQSDLDNLYNMGVGLATAGIGNIGDALLQTSSFHDLMNGKVEEIFHLYDHYSHLYEAAEQDAGRLLLDMVGGPENVAGLFNFSNYDLTSWITDYMDEAAGNYYTQRWYIARREQGSVSLCDYYPPTDDNSILNGGEWTRFETTDAGFYPNASQREQALSNSERYAGCRATGCSS